MTSNIQLKTIFVIAKKYEKAKKNMRKIKTPKLGEYVLLTKYADKNPYDAWFIGFFSRKLDTGKNIVYKAKDDKGEEYYYNKFQHCFRISEEEGQAWLNYYSHT